MTETDTFRCDACQKTFTKKRPDAEAIAEYEEKFGKNFGEELGVLCETCIVEFDKWFAKNAKRFQD